VYQRSGYYAVFYMSFGLIALDITLRLILIEKKVARQWVTEPSTENEEAIRTSRGPGIDSNNAQEKPNLEVGEAYNAQTPEAAIGTTTTYQRSKWPPVLTLLTSPRLLVALWGFIVQGSLSTAFDSVIPLFVEHTFGWDSLGAGLIFLAVMIPSFGAPVVGWASDNYGPRWLCVGGFVSAVPFWTLLRLVDHDSLGQKVLLSALLALIGVSLTLVFPPLMAEITYVVEAKERESPGCFGATGAYAQASSAISFIYSLDSELLACFQNYIFQDDTLKTGADWLDSPY